MIGIVDDLVVLGVEHPKVFHKVYFPLVYERKQVDKVIMIRTKDQIVPEQGTEVVLDKVTVGDQVILEGVGDEISLSRGTSVVSVHTMN